MDNQVKFHPCMFQETYYTGEIHTDNTENIPIARNDIDAYDLKLNKNIVSLNNDVPNTNHSLSDNSRIQKYNDRTVLNGIQETSLLSTLFFCKDNLISIQKLLKLGVYKALGEVIDTQNSQELLLYMRGVYLENAMNPPMLRCDDPPSVKSKILPLYTAEISRLNTLVVHKALPQLVSQVQQYLHYIRDITESPYKNFDPINTSKIGTDDLRSTTQVYLGGNF